MIGYFLLIVLFITFTVLTVILGRKNTEWAPVSVPLDIMLFVSLCFSSTYLGTRAGDAKTFKKDRDYYQELVHSLPDTMSFCTIDRLIGEAKEINARIEDNKRHADSKMWGFLYNKGIAEIEPICFPDFEYKIVKKEYHEDY